MIAATAKFIGKTIFAAVLLVLAVGLPLFLRLIPGFVELAYSQWLYVPISSFFGSVCSRITFAVADVIIVLIISAALSLVTLFVVFLFKKKFSPLYLFNSILTLIIIILSVIIVFNTVWGYNYSRKELSVLMGFDTQKKYDTADLYALCVSLRNEASALRENVYENENGEFALYEDASYYFKLIVKGFSVPAKTYPKVFRTPTPAKSSGLSKLMSVFSITGMFFPFTGEAIVNTDVPPVYTLAAAAHENAHSLGFAREDEANFISYMVCTQVEDTSVRYSGIMSALSYCAYALYNDDAALYNELRRGYSDGMNADISAYQKYFEGKDGFLSTVSEGVNDTYLKANGQKDGTDSYGMVVDLLLCYADRSD